MESLKREIDLRPVSRDLIRVRSEDLGYDPIKDKQQLQEKKDRYTEQQVQLQHHQRQWRLQKRKLHRRLLRKKQRLAEKQLSDCKVDETGTQCQYKRREAWIRGQISTISDTEDDSKTALMHMVEAPLEAHFLKGADRRREMKSEESDSMTEMSSTDDWDDSDLAAEQEETVHLSRGKSGKSASFSTNLKHRLQCARCHIYYHYYHHGHYLANVHTHQPTTNDASQQSKRDARSMSVDVCSPCDYNTNTCLGSEQRPSWNRLRPSFAYENTLSSQKHNIASSELHRSSSESSFSPPALTFQLSNERSEYLRLFSEDSFNSDSEVTTNEAAVRMKHKDSTSKPSIDDSESEYSACDFGLYDDRYICNYSGSFGRGNSYYVLVVVDDADASTDPGSENDDVAAGVASGYARDDSFDVEGSETGRNVSFRPLSESEVSLSQPGVSCPDRKVASLLTSDVSSSTQNCQTEAVRSCTDSTHPHGSLPSINVASVSGSSERHDDGFQYVSNTEHDRVTTGFNNNTCNKNTKLDNDNVKEKSAVKSTSKLPVATNLSSPLCRGNGLVRGSSADSFAFSEVKNIGTENNSYGTCLRPGGKRVMYGNSSIETRRRNFSSSSLPLSLMTATIEEVEDADYVVAPPGSNIHHSQRHSYSENSNPPSKIPFRTLRREARVPSMSSPPGVRRPGPLVGLTRSASDNTYRVTRLKDVDIVGESFTSRFPWQKDVAVQCRLPSDLCVQPNLQRALSGPAEYPSCQSMSMTSNSPSSSPPTPSRRGTMHNYSRSYSQSDVNRYPTTTTSDRTSAHSYHRKSDPQYNRTNYSIANIVTGSGHQHSAPGDNYSAERTGNYQRNAFQRRSRSSLMGSLGNSRSCDTSRQTSTCSLEYDDDIIGYLDPFGDADNQLKSEECLIRDDVLPSPTISPRLWAVLDEDRYVGDSDDSVNVPDDHSVKSKKGFRRHRQPRRLSSGSITSDAESENNEPDPPVARRGRRSAIYETKNCGDVSPTTLSPDVSPSNSCDEGEGASNIAERLRRRRSSVDLAMNIYPGDLLVQEHHKKLIKRNTIADFYAAGKQPNGGPVPAGGGPLTADGVDASKKGRQPFSLLKLMKTRSKESLTKIDEILKRVKPSEFKDNHLAAYKSLHWSDLIASSDKQQNSQTANISDTERKRREAVWELFKSECVFLIDHLMVLKHCFMEPLKKVQVEGSLMYAEPQDLFGNLDELSYVSYTFCKDFIAALLKDMSITDFGRTNVLLKAFQRFSAHSRDGAVYHSYCLNYTNALTYLEKLRANPEFAEFEKWCEQDPRCKRLQLTDLLVAPMQHCTKLPLLLHNVRKYTADEDERQQVTESIEKVETSLKQLEEKMRWIKNFERVQEIQRQIVWPAVTELDPRCVIPESLKPSLSKQPCEKLLACPKRQLLHEGQITLVENPKPLDVHMFLFDDILLITKVKKIPRKSKQSNTDTQSSGQSDRTSYTVLRQPLALDRFTLHDISSSDAAASGLKHCFALVHVSRYQQITGVFTFQAACDATKNSWISQIKEAMDAYAKAASSRNNSFKENKSPKPKEKESASSNERKDFSFTSTRKGMQHRRSESLKGVPTKSRSMDAVFI